MILYCGHAFGTVEVEELRVYCYATSGIYVCVCVLFTLAVSGGAQFLSVDGSASAPGSHFSPGFVFVEPMPDQPGRGVLGKPCAPRLARSLGVCAGSSYVT